MFSALGKEPQNIAATRMPEKMWEGFTPENAAFKCPREDMGDKASAHVKTVALKSPAHYGGGGGTGK